MHALITGGSKGIGYAIAEKILADGLCDRITICARNSSEVQTGEKSLRASFPTAKLLSVVCDVSHEASVAELHRQSATMGSVDILVNNAGFGIFKSILEMTTEEFDNVIATNLRGVFLVTQAFLPDMISRKSGSIVTISSLAGKNGFAGGVAYCSAKFAVRGLMQSLFLEVRDRNIRVITVFPGSVDTDFFSEASGAGSMKSAGALKPEDVAHAVVAALQLPPNADISELDIRPTNPKG